MNYTSQILQRYLLPSRHQRQEKQYGFDDLVHELSIAFEMPAEFNPNAFMNFPIELITDYIRRTHRLYLFRKLPEMEQSIHLLLEDYTDDHPLLSILLDFYSDYKIQLSLHICAEEQHLLPYIDFLLETRAKGLDMYRFFKQTKRYSIREFELDHHDDSEKELHEIRETILAHEPPFTNATPYRILVQQLHNFERDLTVHGLIEDHILIPKTKAIEDQLMQQYQLLLEKN